MSVNAPPRKSSSAGISGSAALVAAGMLVTRIAGFVRTMFFSAIFGVQTDAADAFTAALRIPNFLQNLLGEGVLSASLIPVYASLLKKEHQGTADEVARAILGVLAILAAALVAVGVTWAPALVAIVAEGFSGPKRELTVELVRIMFPGIGFLVLSAWCLAILNSHGRFFLSYVAPVCWNIVIITALIAFRHRDLNHAAIGLAWASLVGCALQFGLQVPSVWRLMAAHWHSRTGTHRPHVQAVLWSSVPVIFTRGVVQVSAWIDSYLASFVAPGAMAAVYNAQQLNQLPIGIFGMAIASAALPSMSMATAGADPDALRSRLAASQEMIAVFIVPSMFAFLLFGDVMIAMLLQHGKFTADDTRYVWAILAGSAVGLLATTIARLYGNAFYALGDTKTPTRIAIVRVALVGGLGWWLALHAPALIGVDRKWGAAGLTTSAGFAGWIEFLLLRRALERRIGAVSISLSFIARAWLAALTAAAVASALRWVIPIRFMGLAAALCFIIRGVSILGVYGVGYLLLAEWLGLADFQDMVRLLIRRGPPKLRAKS